MKRFFGFCRRHGVLLLSLALGCSLLVNVIQRQAATLDPVNNIVGTYGGSGAAAPALNSQYVVFDQEGNYYRYGQSELLERGTYAREGDSDTYRMTPEGAAAPWAAIYVDAAYGKPVRVYCNIEESGGMVPLEKISSVPGFSNIDPNGPLGKQPPRG